MVKFCIWPTFEVLGWNLENHCAWISSLKEGVVPRGRHWDPNPNPTNSGLGFGLGSIFQNFGIGTGIDFSKFWDWDWHRFFKILGLGLGLGLQIQDKIPRNPKGRYRNFK